MTVGVAVALLLVGGVIWYFLNSSDSGSSSASAAASQKTATQNPASSSSQTGSNPLQKYVEVVGLRMVTENQKPVVKFVVVNHSGTEIDDLAANVTLVAGTSKSDEDSVGSFSFKVPMLGPNDVKDLTVPLNTKLKMYELPDWQNTTAEIEITSPAAQ
jgi:hypothetical protein